MKKRDMKLFDDNPDLKDADAWQVGWDLAEDFTELEFFDEEDDALEYAKSLEEKGETGICLTKLVVAFSRPADVPNDVFLWENGYPEETWELVDGNWEYL